jgi:bacterioferritin (cytochrome b1)
MVQLGYQTREEEEEILKAALGSVSFSLTQIVDLIRSIRNHPMLKRGASIRAGIAIGELMKAGMPYEASCITALPTRIEMLSSDEDPIALIKQLLEGTVFPQLEKKKSHTI